jgi:hypothetical protein
MADIVWFRNAGIAAAVLALYPRLLVVDREDPALLPLTGASFAAGTCFVAHTVTTVHIWVSAAAPLEFLQNAFGATGLEDLPTFVPEIDSKENRGLHDVIEECWAISRRHLPVEIIRQGDARECIFRDILIDDAVGGGMRLSDWFDKL